MPDITRRQFTIAASLTPLATFPSIARGAAVDKIKVGQIGVTHAHASGKIQAMRKLSKTFDVVGLADTNLDRAKKAVTGGSYRGLKPMTIEQLLNVPGLQAVAVETDIDDLVPTAIACISAGMHVHLDKPAGQSLPAFKKLCDLADRKKRTIQMGYMLRYNPAFELLFKAVRENWLGEIYELDAMMGKLASSSLRKQLGKYPGGGMFELACHVVDAAVTVLGPPTKVTPFIKRTKQPANSFADNQLVVLSYPKATATIRCNHADPFGFPRRRFQVAGSAGALEVKPLESGQVELSLAQVKGEYKKGTQQLKLARKGGRYDGEFADLARVIRGEKELAWNRKHDLAVHETVLRACEMSLD